jgi:hypothetical protein
MSPQNDLLRIEDQFWTGGPEARRPIAGTRMSNFDPAPVVMAAPRALPPGLA